MSFFQPQLENHWICMYSPIKFTSSYWRKIQNSHLSHPGLPVLSVRKYLFSWKPLANGSANAMKTEDRSFSIKLEMSNKSSSSLQS